jgi:hypothetical protein
MSLAERGGGREERGGNGGSGRGKEKKGEKSES